MFCDSPPRSRRLSGSLCFAFALFVLLQASLLFAQVSVLTRHNDLQRTGQNLSETTLNTSNVSINRFGKLYSRPLDGELYTQPLYMPGLTVGGGVHNVLFLATIHNSVYAFDADSATGANANPLWRASLGTPVPSSVINTPNLPIEVGIVGTPVIDPNTKTLYVVAKNYVGNVQSFKLHALDILTGAEKLGAPVNIAASVPGTADGGTTVAFRPDKQNQRPALTLVGNNLYIGFSSHEDYSPYHGWVLAYNATTLQQTAVHCNTPYGNMAGIWMSGDGFAVDANNNIYYVGGNGDYDGVRNFGESVVKLSPTLSILDWFTPYDYNYLNSIDFDLSSSSSIGLPGTTLLAAGAKNGKVYLLDTNNMGKWRSGNDNQTVQWFQASGGHIHSSMLYYNSPTRGRLLYVWGENDVVKAWSFNGSVFQTTPVDQSTISVVPGYANGPGMSISANGSVAGTGILWSTLPLGDAVHQQVPGIIRAFDASNLSTELWNSQQNLARDDFGKWAKWCPPTVVNGRVYVSTLSNQLCVYGLLTPAAPAGLTATPGDKQIVLNWQPVSGISSYNVKRSTTNGGPYTTIKSGSATTSCTDIGLLNGTTYYYVVSAVNSNLEGANSGQISAVPSAGASSATFVKLDSTTQGTWKTVYGNDGYSLQGDATLLPGYAQVVVAGGNTYTWNGSTTDVRALQKATGTDRIAACLYSSSSFTIDINLTDGLTHQVSLYALDWDYNNRNATFEALDSATNAVLDTRTLTPFDSGKYLVWSVKGHVKFRVTNVGSSNCVFSGLFFDTAGPPTVPVAPTGLTTSPGNAQVVLNWQAVAGATSYNVKRAAAHNGPYSVVKTGQTTASYTDTGLTNGTTYYYVVSAINGVGEGANSLEASALPIANSNAATFVKLDTTTQGNWKTVYGLDGYSIQGLATSLPAYAQLTLTGANAYTWNGSSTDIRALQKLTGTDRIAACWYADQNFLADINLTDGQSHQVAIYALDWDYNNRNIKLEVLDAVTNAVLDTQNLTPFDSGKYLVWNLRGHVKIRVTNINASNAVISGLFFK